MKKIINNYSLKKMNTYGIDVKTQYFIEINREEDFYKTYYDKEFSSKKKLVLGEGANVLFTKDFDGLVIRVKIKGINVIEEKRGHIIVEVGAGENWHEFVTWSVNNNYGGLENMALIPGTVGAAPVQNIAAYGENFQDVFISLDAINTNSGEKRIFKKSECDFTYRDSFFKTGKGRGKWLITKVRVKLNKNAKVNTSYFETGKTFKEKVSILSELESLNRKPPFTIKDIYDAVVSIRSQKLPDPKKIGNAGSVFKNPVITKVKYKELLLNDPDLQCYPVNALTYPKIDDPKLSRDYYVKIPAGRLLDNLGWRGKRIGNAGVHDKHALIVVNYGGATPSEITKIISMMQKDVKKNYDINLELEIVII